MRWMVFLLFFLYILNLGNSLNAEKLLVVSGYPNVLDNKHWKNFFRGKNWKKYEILEADKNNLFLYLNSYRIPKGMEWKKPSWGLWNLGSNSFRPLTKIPSNLIPIRKIGNQVFLKNRSETAFYTIDIKYGEKVQLIQSSVKIRGWFPRTDGSIAYIIEDENCNQFKGRREGKLWSVCILGSDMELIQKVISTDPLTNPMLTGISDNFIVFWHRNMEEKLWFLGAINLETGNLKILTKSNIKTINKQIPPKWLSWIENDWVVYEIESKTEDEKKEDSNSRSFIVHNLQTDKRKKILLGEKGNIMVEIGNYSSRKFSYNPYINIIDTEGELNKIKVIDANEMRVVKETFYPFPYEKDRLKSAYFP